MRPRSHRKTAVNARFGDRFRQRRDINAWVWKLGLFQPRMLRGPVRETALLKAGRPLRHVCLPHGGAISMMARLAEGRTVEMATIGRDSVFAAAMLDRGISLTSAIVVLAGTASVLDAIDFRATADRRVAFRAVVARHERALLAMAPASGACNASHAVEARLSRYFAHTIFARRNLAADAGISVTTD